LRGVTLEETEELRGRSGRDSSFNASGRTTCFGNSRHDPWMAR
jgi:hypothetical protein